MKDNMTPLLKIFQIKNCSTLLQVNNHILLYTLETIDYYLTYLTSNIIHSFFSLQMNKEICILKSCKLLNLNNKVFFFSIWPWWNRYNINQILSTHLDLGILRYFLFVCYNIYLLLQVDLDTFFCFICIYHLSLCLQVLCLNFSTFFNVFHLFFPKPFV